MAVTYAINHSTITTNLISWFPMNEYSGATGAVTRYDAHGSKDLTDNNTVASATGNINKAASFTSASSEYFTTASNFTDVSGTAAMSINLWVKTSTDNGTSMVCNVNDGVAETFQLIKIAGSNIYQFSVRTSGGLYTTPTIAEGSIEDGAWHMITCTYDGSNVRIYLDGSEQGSGTSASGNINSSNPAKLGYAARSTGADLFWNGVMEDAAIWSKALSTDEITDLYNSGEGMTYGIEHDRTVQPSSTTGTTHTFSHTCTGANRLLLVYGHDTSGGSSTVTGVTYNGTAMTKITGVRDPASGRWITMWYLINPSTGANNVVVTSSSSQNLRFSASSYTGVDQTSFDEGNDTFASSSSLSSFSTSITTGTDHSWMVTFIKDETGGQTYTNTTGDIIRINADAGGHMFADTNEDIDPAGSNTMTHTLGTARTDVKGIAFAFAPVSEAAATTFTPKVMWFS